MRRSPLSKALRLKVENALETLLALLDEADGDCDLEPSLGRTEPANWGSCCGQSSAGRNDDSERDVGDEQEAEDRYIYGGVDEAA